MNAKVKEKLEVSADDAQELLNALGHEVDGDSQVIADELGNLVELTRDKDLSDLSAEQTDLLDEILNALDSEVEILVTDGEDGAAEEPPAKKPARRAPKEKPTAEANGAEEVATTEKPARKPREKKAAAEGEKGEKSWEYRKPKKREDGVSGLNPEAKTRAYYAGVVLAKHGVTGGITDAMVKEVDKLYGEENPYQSVFYLRNAWHAVRGYLEKKKD